MSEALALTVSALESVTHSEYIETVGDAGDGVPGGLAGFVDGIVQDHVAVDMFKGNLKVSDHDHPRA
jgi:hypothetical protein